MQYKTTVLGLLQERPQIYDQLLSKRTLLPILERYATELRNSHHAWQDYLGQAKPGSHQQQIASEAMEMALQELEDNLPSGFPPNDNEPLSLAAAMGFITRHTPPA